MPFLYASSFSRDSGTDSNFSINAQSALGLGRSYNIQEGFQRIRLVSAELVFTAYNVDARNGTLRVLEQTGGLTAVATLAAGNYDVDTLPSALATALTAASLATGNHLTYTVTFSALTGKLTISATGAFKVLAPVTRLAALNQLTGMSLSSDSAAYATSQVGPRCVNFSRYPVGFIHCSLVDPSSSWNSLFAPTEADGQVGQTQQILAALPLATYSFGSIVEFQPTEKRWHPLSSSTLGRMNFALRDEQGQEIPLNGCYISMTLEVE